ncbi:DUF86 domain-containing protein [Paenibacillus athensensis]|uniref:DUF86 domain-containing protein n=1 Tax=Paenibacillus athensensis TaxID=1967502 RepID=A0A4Y8Q9M0_9BACL|nr:HepT-like ribonuclease domain-containing protein [Paenibacillus athensensis]MCD1258992.1 DUF86 domain-containing protein [Paenibacillus athensensis]
MYFVNREQIEQRLSFAAVAAEACREVERRWTDTSGDLLLQLAQERALHLAIETVTDVGSLLIDAYILRDASSYEDIVDILRDERAADEALASLLLELVKLRKPLVQDYISWPRAELHPLLPQLPEALERFATGVRTFMEREALR